MLSQRINTAGYPPVFQQPPFTIPQQRSTGRRRRYSFSTSTYPYSRLETTARNRKHSKPQSRSQSQPQSYHHVQQQQQQQQQQYQQAEGSGAKLFSPGSTFSPSSSCGSADPFEYDTESIRRPVKGFETPEPYTYSSTSSSVNDLQALRAALMDVLEAEALTPVLSMAEVPQEVPAVVKAKGQWKGKGKAKEVEEEKTCSVTVKKSNGKGKGVFRRVWSKVWKMFLWVFGKRG